MKKIIILGSTGSIGENTLDVVRTHPDKIKVTGLCARGNLDLLRRQIVEFKPQSVTLWDRQKAELLQQETKGKINIYSGIDGILSLINSTEAGLVVCALVGAVGLKPTIEVIRCGKDVALANKEVLVMAGELIINEVSRSGVKLIPIDSEHSALAQCLWQRDPLEVKRLVITASGGPFYNQRDLDLNSVSPQDALKHPRWQMGPKVTVDSATLMNKGFEVIEASYLFGIPVDKIDVVIHPESIIHSMVEFIDGSVIAQMSIPDMRIPIQYALSYPQRWPKDFGSLDLTSIGSLNFTKPDKKRFPALELAYQAMRSGGTMPAVLNASDEVCVEKFLAGEIRFGAIVPIIGKIIQRHEPVSSPEIDNILEADNWARQETVKECKKLFSEERTAKPKVVS